MTQESPGARRPLRIGMIIALWPPEGLGGAELQARRLAQELVLRGHEVHVFIRGAGVRPRTEQSEGIQLHRRPVLPLPGLRLLMEIFWGAMQAGRAGLDVVLCYMTFNTGLLGYAAHLTGGTPFVIWQRSLAEATMRRGHWLSRLSVFLNGRAASVWLQSEGLLATLEREYRQAGFGPSWESLRPHLRVLANGVDISEIPDDEGVPPARFLFVGRLVEEKNLPVLLEASRSLLSGEIWIVGTGPLRTALEEAAVGAPVRFLGKQPPEKISELLRQSRALVLPSREEGMPNVALEALAHGRPVVATPVGSIPEFVKDGDNGCLVPVGQVEPLARALQGLLNDGAWRRLAASTRGSVARFGWDRLVSQVEEQVEEILMCQRETP